LLQAKYDTNTSTVKKTTIILSQKTEETNESNISATTSIKLFLIDTYNSLMPKFLEVSPKDNFLHYYINYDIKNKKLSQSLSVNVFLPSFERTVTKQSPKKEKNKTLSLKIIPFITYYDSTPSLVIKSQLTADIQKGFVFYENTVFTETFYYYVPEKDYREITEISFKKLIRFDNLMFKMSKSLSSEDPSNINYDFSTYFFNDYSKYIRVYGLTLSGERKKDPFIYSYKLFFTYSHLIFNNKHVYFTFSPYLLFSKEFHYHPKTFADISLHIKF
jgi:hypothetical protein